jgi:RHS repeat-associated protein
VVAGGTIDPRVSATPAGFPASGGVTRGFTGHEEEQELGIVNMGGRIYDPRVGRFMQADPLVASPYVSQAFNRYNYVLNSPLGMTDPTGFVASCAYDEAACSYQYDQYEGPISDPFEDHVSSVSHIRDSFYEDAPFLAEALNSERDKKWAIAEGWAALARQMASKLSSSSGSTQAVTTGRDSASIKKQAEALGLNLPPDWSFDYVEKLTGATAQTNPLAKTVTLSASAFKTPSSLKSTLVHEFTHVRQWEDGNYARGGSKLGISVNQIEAFVSELNAAKRTGLSAAEVNSIEKGIRKEISVLANTPGGDYYLGRIFSGKSGSFVLQNQDRYLRPGL